MAVAPHVPKLLGSVLVLALAAPVLAQAPWVPAGFGGAGAFIGVQIDPGAPNVVYLQSDVAGIYRSTDYGDSWRLQSTGVGNGEISSLAIDPFDSTHVLAGPGAFSNGAKAGMYESTDSGQTWTQMGATLASGISFRRYSTSVAIAFDPAQQGVIVTGSQKVGVWRSTDGGASFVQVLAAPQTSALVAVDDPNDPRPPGPYPAPVSELKFDPADPNVVFAAFDGAGIYKSSARGVAGSFTPSSTGLPAEAKINGIAFGCCNGMFAAAELDGIYRSTDRGGTWTAINGNLPLSNPELPWVSSVAAHPTSNPTILYLTLVCYSYQSIWTSSDYGATWIEANPANITYDYTHDPTRNWTASQTWAWQVTMDPSNTSRLYFVDFWGVFRSDDGGTSWVEKVNGAQDTCVTALVVDTDHPVGQPDSLWAAHWDCGLLRSTDGGASFAAVLPWQWDTSLVGHYWTFAAANVGGSKYLYTTSDPGDSAYTIGQVMRSSDDGATWQQVFSNPRPAGTWLGGFMIGFAVDGSQPSTVYVLQDGGQIWKSTSRGDPGTWAPTPSQPLANDFTYALIVDSAGRVYVGTLNDGLFRSTDGGSSWSSVLPGQSTVFHAASAGSDVYVTAGDDNLYRTSDGGATFQQLTSFTAIPDPDGGPDQGMAVAIDPNDPNHILFSREQTWHPMDQSPGVVESTDGGATWTDASVGLTWPSVNVLTIGSDGSVWAGTTCAGIYRRAAQSAGGYQIAAGRGPDPAGNSEARIFDTVGTQQATMLPYATALFGCNVGDGLIRPGLPAALLTGPGPSSVYGPHVKAFDAGTGQPIAKVSFYAYGTLRYGVKAGAADIDGDGNEEILSGPGPGAVFGPHVRGFNFDGASLSPIAKVSYFAYGTLKWGVNDTGGDIDLEPSYEEIVTGPGPGTVFGPQVRGFNFDGATVTAMGQLNAMVFTGKYGALVSVANLDSSSTQEAVAGRGPAPANAADVTGLGYGNVPFALGITLSGALYGAVPAGADIGGATPEEILVAPGPDPAASARVAGWAFTGGSYAPSSVSFVPFSPSSYGARVAAGTFF